MGEILLIAIGVLLAVFLNNLNNNRIDRKIEQVTLRGLSSEMKLNIHQLEKVIFYHDDALNAGLKLATLVNNIDHSHLEEKYLDSLFAAQDCYWTFDPRIGFLKSTLSSGAINNIENDTLRIMLTSFMDVVLDVNESTVSIIRLLENRLWPILDNEISFNNRTKIYVKELPDGVTPSMYENVLSNQEVENIIGNITTLRIEGLNEERELLKSLLLMQEIIQSEIQ